jgi:hypothetical protein
MSCFRLTGKKLSGIFEPDFKPAQIEEQELLGKKKLKYALWAKIQNQGDQDFSKELWDITCEEYDIKYWLDGSFLENNLNQDIKVHGCHVDGLRYGNQSPINNFSENGVNSAYSVCEKIHLRALDETIWISLIIMYIMKERGIFSFSLLDGTAISGKLHGS